MYFSYFHFSNWKIFFFWSFVIIQLNEVIRRIFYFSSRWLLFYIPTIRICLWASSNDFLVKFWKVTVLQVNWLVSQECSWELSNLLYLYPSKISNLRRGFFFFQFAFVQSERGIKHECFKTLGRGSSGVVWNVFHFLVMKSNKLSLVIFGWHWVVPRPIIINQSTWRVKLNSWQNFKFQKLITENCLFFFNKKVGVNFDIMHKHYWREVSIKFKPTENKILRICPGSSSVVILSIFPSKNDRL